MAYSYYLTYVHNTQKEDTGTNVYAESEQQAKEIGAILLSRLTGRSYTASNIIAEVDDSIQEDDITTT